MSGQWSPTSLLLSGSFCPSAAFRKHAKNLGKQIKADSICVLTFRDHTFFQSMVLFVDLSSPNDLMVERMLRDTPITVNGSLRERIGLPKRTTSGTIERLCPNLLSQTPFAALRECISNETITTILTATTTENVAVYALVFGDKVRRARKSEREWLRTALLMAASSMAVYYHNLLWAPERADASIARQEKELQSLLARPNSLNVIAANHALKRFAKSILKLGVSLTRSEAGVLFFVSRTGKLRCVAKTAKVPVPNECRTVSKDAVARGRLVLAQPDFISSSITLTPPVSAILTIPIGHSSLTPITSSRVRKSKTVFAVITLFKTITSRVSDFSPSDLAMGQYLALRLNILRTHFLSAFSSTSIAHTLAGAASTGSKRNQSAFQIREDYETLIPPELHGALARINNLLQQAYYVTNSLSATVRLLSLDGRSLVRACAYPSRCLNDTYAIITLDDLKSINAQVARSGLELYAADVQSIQFRASFKEARPATKSEWCYPIFLCGRVVGTINVESGIIDAYSNSAHYLRAMACQVCLALQDSRRAAEEVILSIGANSSLSAHELLHVRDRLNVLSHARAGKSQMQKEVGEIARAIDACVKPEFDFKHRFPNLSSFVLKGTLTLTGLTMAIAKDLAIDPFIAFPSTPDALLLAPELVEPFAIAVGETLGNAVKALPLAANITIRQRREKRAGRSYHRLTIGHAVNSEVRDTLPSLCRRLYRVAITRKDRVHIGALIAGSIVRNAGGEMFAEFDGDSVYTHIELPEAL